MVEFPPTKAGKAPETSIVPEIWLLRETQEAWWPFHLKTDIAINLAISKRSPVGAGYKKTPYTKIIRNYSEYPLLCDILFWFLMGCNFVTGYGVDFEFKLK